MPLGNTCLLHLYLYLFWWGSCLVVTLVSVSSLPFLLWLHIQFPQYMCTSSIWCACMFNFQRICAQILYLDLLDWCVACACKFNSHGICAWVLYSDLLDWCVAHACIFNSHGIYSWVALVFWLTKECWVKDPLRMMNDSRGVWFAQECVGDSWGSLLGMESTGEDNLLRSLVSRKPLYCVIHWEISCSPSWLTGELVLIPPMRGFYQLHRGYFLHNSQGGCLCVLDPCGSPSMILYFIGNLVGDLNSRGSFLGDLWSNEECFDAFNPIWDALRAFVSFT